MFQNVPYRLVPLSRCVLAKLYVEHVNDSDLDAFSVDEVKGLFSVGVSRNLVSSALDELHGPRHRDDTLVNRPGTKKAEWRYRISSAGIQFIENALRDSASDISYFLAHGDPSLNEIAGLDAIFWTTEEHLERDNWTEIELEQTPDLQEAIDSLNKTILEIEKNNEFEVKNPEQKQGILHSLRLGIASLRGHKVSKNQLNSLIIQPLRWVSASFANTVMSELAKATAQRVVKLILSYLT